MEVITSPTKRVTELAVLKFRPLLHLLILPLVMHVDDSFLSGMS